MKKLTFGEFALPHTFLFQSPIKQKPNMHVRDQTKLTVY